MQQEKDGQREEGEEEADGGVEGKISGFVLKFFCKGTSVLKFMFFWRHRGYFG